MKNMGNYMDIRKLMRTFAVAKNENQIKRGVAQPGSAPGLGPGGRRFESCRPDYYLHSFPCAGCSAAR